MPFERFERLAVEEARLFEQMTPAERVLVLDYAKKRAAELDADEVQSVAARILAANTEAGFYLAPPPGEGSKPAGQAYAQGFVFTLVRCCGGGAYAGLALAPGGWRCGDAIGARFCQPRPAPAEASAAREEPPAQAPTSAP